MSYKKPFSLEPYLSHITHKMYIQTVKFTTPKFSELAPSKEFTEYKNKIPTFGRVNSELDSIISWQSQKVPVLNFKL